MFGDEPEVVEGAESCVIEKYEEWTQNRLIWSPDEDPAVQRSRHVDLLNPIERIRADKVKPSRTF